jgi:hypothetical protein
MKTLQEVQEFNRRNIICSINGTENYEEALKKEEGDSCRFGRVLSALLKINDNLRIKHWEESIIEVYESIWCEDHQEYECIANFYFDLTKETLEEQSEETQRAIYKLLGGKNE